MNLINTLQNIYIICVIFLFHDYSLRIKLKSILKKYLAKRIDSSFRPFISAYSKGPTEAFNIP